jgi:hypothetical protein
MGRHPAKWLAVMLAIGLMVGGLYLRSREMRRAKEDAKRQRRLDARDQLLAALTERPLFRQTNTGYRARSLETVRGLVHTARREGLDLHTLYRDAREPSVRASLAYMLVVDGSEDYLAGLADANATSGEVLVWLHAVELAEAGELPADLGEALARRAMLSNTPAGFRYASLRYDRAGAPGQARQAAREALGFAPNYYSAQAARMLLEQDPNDPEALAYARRLTGSDDPTLARYGLLALAEAAGGTDWPAYRAYRTLDTPANEAELRRRLAEHGNAP